jgi:hypothetical protein
VWLWLRPDFVGYLKQKQDEGRIARKLHLLKTAMALGYWPL